MENETFKRCTKCLIEKSIDDFHLRNAKSTKRKPRCKQCLSQIAREYQEKNKAKIKEQSIKYRLENAEKLKNNAKVYNAKNKEKMSSINKSYHEANKERILQRKRDNYLIKAKANPRYEEIQRVKQERAAKKEQREKIKAENDRIKLEMINNPPTSKKCTKCLIEKGFDSYHKSPKKKFGIHSQCKECCNKRKRDFIEKNKEFVLARARKNHALNRDEINKRKRGFRNNNLERFRDYSRKYSKKYREENSEKLSINRKNYYIKNKPSIRSKINSYRKIKNQTDPEFKFLNLIRNRFKISLNGRPFTKDREKIIGCSMSDFVLHIKSQLTGDMTIENHGKLWHVDHIIPVNTLRGGNKDKFHLVFNYRNHKPLLKFDNLSKHDYLDESKEYLIEKMRVFGSDPFYQEMLSFLESTIFARKLMENKYIIT